MAYSFALESYLRSFSLYSCQIMHLLVVMCIDLHKGNAHHAQSNDDYAFLCCYSHCDKMILKEDTDPSKTERDHEGMISRSLLVINGHRDIRALLQKRVSLVLETTLLPCHAISCHDFLLPIKNKHLRETCACACGVKSISAILSKQRGPICSTRLNLAGLILIRRQAP